MASAGSTVSCEGWRRETRRYPWACNAVTAPRSMHRGEEPRDAETGQPGPHRLAADAEVPRSDHGVGAADQIIDRQQPDTAVAHRHAAVGGVVAVVAHHEQMVRRHGHFRRVVEPAIVAKLENRMRNAIGQSLDIAMGWLYSAVAVFGFASPIGLQRCSMIVDEELALPHLDAITGQADDTLDPGLRPVAGPAEHHDIAELRRFAEHASSLGQVDLNRQRGGAVAIGIFRRQQRVADQKRGLHGARRHIERLGEGTLGNENGEHDRRQLDELAAPAMLLRGHSLIVDAHRPVPPTVMRSIRSVGWPTPTGTPWPFLPQVPMPESSARSLPIMVMRCRSVGPLPISIAPFSGEPTLPFSIL